MYKSSKIKKNLAIILLLSMVISPISKVNAFGLSSIFPFFYGTKTQKKLNFSEKLFCKKNSTSKQYTFSKPSILATGFFGVSILALAIIFRKEIANFFSNKNNKPEDHKSSTDTQAQPTDNQNLNNNQTNKPNNTPENNNNSQNLNNNQINQPSNNQTNNALNNNLNNKTDNNNSNNSSKKTCVIFYDDEEHYTEYMVEELKKESKLKSCNIIEFKNNDDINNQKYKNIDILLCVSFKPSCRFNLLHPKELAQLEENAKNKETLFAVSQVGVSTQSAYYKNLDNNDIDYKSKNKCKMFNFLLSTGVLTKNNEHNDNALREFNKNI